MRVACALLALGAGLRVARAGAGAGQKTLVYTGSLNDETGKPVGGVFWFRFALHRAKSEKKMLWSEELYVAVDRGTYQVELGKERPIPQALPLTDLFLAIHVDGIEVQRVRVDETMVSGGPAEPPSADPQPAACEACKTAERAADADRLNGMSVEQLTELMARKEVQVGTGTHYTSSVGSSDGTPFRITCPPGTVVTGIKGKADDRISNLQLICSPLEAK